MSRSLCAAVLLSAVPVSARAVGSDACLDCRTDTCVLLPPDGSSFPCYEGALEDANKCYNTDPLLSADTTYKCSTCVSEGYDLYLQNDPIYKNMELWTKSSAASSSATRPGSDACLECADDVCALLPPSGSSFPCYQGSDRDANVCYNTDPLLPDGSTYACGTCAAAGYPTYMQNDPIYKNMELWSASSSAAGTAASLEPFHPTQADIKGKALSLNTTTGGPYTYSQSNHHFFGTAYDGSYIDTTSACAGANDECRDNPDCQCTKNEGPLPQGTYTLGDMFTYKGYPYSYQLFPSASNNMCGRDDFLIHGGNCASGNPSIGCIVIESESTRYMIKSGATLKVVG